MNKMIKGSIAGATGVALLMGGFGTFALWSDTETLGATGVTSGELDIATTAGVWDDENTTSSAADWSSSDLMVPGDKVSYTQTFTVKGTGKNLKGTVSLASSTLSSSFGTNNLTRTVVVTSNNAAVAQATPAGTFAFTSGFGTATLTAEVTYTFASVAGQSDQAKSATTPAAAFTITQS